MRVPRDLLEHIGRAVLAIAVISWLVIVTLILQHRIFVTHDSMISYAHAWWIESRLWHGHGIPWRMPVLGHGGALTFPYGSAPWLVAALLWPLTGDWSVTAVLVVGAVGLIAATFWAFPETRRPWWAVVVLVNPILVLAPLSGQLPFLWASALLVAGIGCWRRGMRARAIVLVGLGQLCHPAVVLPIAAVLVVARLRSEPDRGRLLRAYAMALCMAGPAIVAVMVSPVFTDSSVGTRLIELVETVSVRAAVLAPPLVAVLLLRDRRRWLPPVLAAVALVMNVVVFAPLDARFSWGALRRQPDQSMAAFTATPQFRPGATYRVLRSSDGKVGMYELIRRGGRLDSEFFPESMWFGRFANARGYSRFLAARNVDYVLTLVHPGNRAAKTESALLAQLATSGKRCSGDLVGVRLVRGSYGWDEYAIDRACLSSSVRR